MAELLDPDIASPFAPRRFDMVIEKRRNIINRRRCQQFDISQLDIAKTTSARMFTLDTKPPFSYSIFHNLNSYNIQL